MSDSFLTNDFVLLFTISFMSVFAPYIIYTTYYPPSVSHDSFSKDVSYTIDDGVKEEEIKPVTIDNDSDKSDVSDGCREPTYYRNRFWPSPRPVNFVRELIKMKYNIQLEGRLTHRKAITILSQHAGIDESLFLKIDPISFSKLFMPSLFNYEKVIGLPVHVLYEEFNKNNYIEKLCANGKLVISPPQELQ
jgi:hypothetical protein